MRTTRGRPSTRANTRRRRSSAAPRYDLITAAVIDATLSSQSRTLRENRLYSIRDKFLRSIALLMLVGTLSYFSMLATKNGVVIGGVIIFFILANQAMSGLHPAHFADPFPANVRYSGSAMAYTGVNILTSGPTPLIAAWPPQKSGRETRSLRQLLGRCFSLVCTGRDRSGNTTHEYQAITT